MSQPKTIKEASVLLKKGDISARQLAEEALKVVKNGDKEIHAYLEIFENVLEQADIADKIIKSGKGGTLTGIPLALKDNILLKGKIASAGSKILENYRAVYDASVVKKIKDAGGVFMGRTNMDEFAMGSSTENSAYGATKNPYDMSRVAGGSSGGSAAATSIGGVLGALGSDTGGSIRQPAAFCGVVGLKPTYGAVSRFGLMAMGSSLDQIGPFAKTTEDAEILFNAISFHDPLDSTSVPDSLRKYSGGNKKVIGVPKFSEEGTDEEILKALSSAREVLKERGYKVKEIDLESFKHALSSYYVIMPAEVSSNLARYDGARYGVLQEGKNLLETYEKTRGGGFGKEVRRRILLGTYVLSAGYYDAYYGKAWAVRNLIGDSLKEAFKEVDAIFMPTTPTSAFKIGEKTKDPLSMYLADIFTVPANLAGVPAISVPFGKTKAGLPIGLQFMAPHWGEKTLFDLGKAIERE